MTHRSSYRDKLAFRSQLAIHDDPPNEVMSAPDLKTFGEQARQLDWEMDKALGRSDDFQDSWRYYHNSAYGPYEDDMGKVWSETWFGPRPVKDVTSLTAHTYQTWEFLRSGFVRLTVQWQYDRWMVMDHMLNEPTEFGPEFTIDEIQMAAQMALQLDR